MHHNIHSLLSAVKKKKKKCDEILLQNNTRDIDGFSFERRPNLIADIFPSIILTNF